METMKQVTTKKVSDYPTGLRDEISLALSPMNMLLEQLIEDHQGLDTISRVSELLYQLLNQAEQQIDETVKGIESQLGTIDVFRVKGKMIYDHQSFVRAELSQQRRKAA